MASPSPLASKEASLFRQVIRHYDSKQYKKGVKIADQILRKRPDHGETLAMKALNLSSLGKNEEAFVLAKAALQYDIRSHVCWHVYGLLYRSEKNHEEAAKAYRYALKLEPESQQIQRDLALLQIQMRDYQGYIASRLAIMRARPALRQNWTAVAIAYHLAGELSSAESVLTTYEETLKQPPPKTDIEHSEALLYKNTIIAQRGDTERALDHLEAVSKSIVDKLAVMEMRADYLLTLERYDEACKAYRTLIERNSENRLYYYGLDLALKGKNGENGTLVEACKEWAEKQDSADAPRRLPLEHLRGDEFRHAADQYLRRLLTKGAPSTFANVRDLYMDHFKRDTIREIVEGYASGQYSTHLNGSADGQVNGETNGEDHGKESKLNISSLYFLAQHYNYKLSRDLDKAMTYVEKAIELEPNNVDYHMLKGRIWKHYGNVEKACEIMDHARSLDERDRYINSKAAKYQLRTNKNDVAITTMSKFTRNESAGGPLGDLHDMQCMWYLIEDGEAYQRQGNLGLALKRYNSVGGIFDTWQEDQFDFHTFSLRKGQIRAYVDMLRWEDQLRCHPFYSRTAISAIEIYLLLHDQRHNPDAVHGNDPNGTLQNGVKQANERKKAMKKAKKEQQKQENIDSTKAQAKSGASNSSERTEAPKKVDPDPSGVKLTETSEPLMEAMKFLEPLLEFNPHLVEAQTVGFEVFFRRKKYLLALKCLLAASRIDKDHPALHPQIIRFNENVESIRSSVPEKARTVIDSTFNLMSGSPSSSSYNDSFLASHPESTRHTQAALCVRNTLKPETRDQNETELIKTLDLEDCTLEDAVKGVKILRMWHRGGSQDEGGSMKEYRRKAQERWPKATLFEKELPWDRLLINAALLLG